MALHGCPLHTLHKIAHTKNLTFTQTSIFCKRVSETGAIRLPNWRNSNDASLQGPVNDTLFVLNDVLGLERYNNLPGFADATPDMVEAILGEAAKGRRGSPFPAELFRRSGRLHCATTMAASPRRRASRRPIKPIAKGGWIGLAVPEEFGGQGLLYALHTAVGEYTSAANMSLMMYPGLTQGAIAAILVHGTDEQKETYLPKMVSGELVRHHEPDRAALRHRSRPAADQGGAAGGRQLQDLRPEDLHLRRRARPDRQHRPSGAGPHRRRARGHQGHLALHRAEVPGQGKTARRAPATPSPAAPSSTRWASTATPPAS